MGFQDDNLNSWPGRPETAAKRQDSFDKNRTGDHEKIAKLEKSSQKNEETESDAIKNLEKFWCIRWAKKKTEKENVNSRKWLRLLQGKKLNFKINSQKLWRLKSETKPMFGIELETADDEQKILDWKHNLKSSNMHKRHDAMPEGQKIMKKVKKKVRPKKNKNCYWNQYVGCNISKYKWTIKPEST